MDRHCACHVLTTTARWLNEVLLNSLSVAAIYPLLALILLSRVSLTIHVLVCMVTVGVWITTLDVLLRIALSTEVSFIPLSVSRILIISVVILPRAPPMVVWARHLLLSPLASATSAVSLLALSLGITFETRLASIITLPKLGSCWLKRWVLLDEPAVNFVPQRACGHQLRHLGAQQVQELLLFGLQSDLKSFLHNIISVLVRQVAAERRCLHDLVNHL